MPGSDTCLTYVLSLWPQKPHILLSDTIVTLRTTQISNCKYLKVQSNEPMASLGHLNKSENQGMFSKPNLEDLNYVNISRMGWGSFPTDSYVFCVSSLSLSQLCF